MTQPACCARYSTEITRAEAEVRRIARLLSNAVAKSRPTTKLMAQVARAKTEVAKAHQLLEEHEAEHAA